LSIASTTLNMKLFAAVLAAAAIGAANAECPNACSGHGTCGANDACSCYDNWMGGDCSQRVCPFGLAFVDTPRGDLNHDGSVDQGDSVLDGRGNAAVDEVWQGSTADVAHFYTECSGKGSCDRAAGTCSCFDGYSGSSCQRTSCPNDCSGHGACFTLREIAAGENSGGSTTGRNYRVTDSSFGQTTSEGVSTSFSYNLWDADKNQACVCDKGYFGPDCSMRECPKGDDPLTTDDKHCGGTTCASEVQYFIAETIGAGTASYRMYFEWADGEEYSGLIANSGKLRSSVFTMREGLSGDSYAELVQDALETFPDGALSGVTVTCVNAQTSGDGSTYAAATCADIVDTAWDTTVLKMDFTNGPSGNVNPLTLHAAEAVASGTHPMAVTLKSSAGTSVLAAGILEGASGAASSSPNAASYTVAETATDGNRENAVCSNRGVCDFSTGECQCFSGYTREDCSKQAALAF